MPLDVTRVVNVHIATGNKYMGCVFDSAVANPFVRHRRARRQEKAIVGAMLIAVSFCRPTYTTPT